MGLDIWHVQPTLDKEKFAGEFFTIDQFDGDPGYFERHKEFIVNYSDEETPTMQVMYFEEAGYQRKMMSQKIFEEFEDCKFYFAIEAPLKALALIQCRDPVEETKIKNEFRKNFIENFIRGRSIFFISS